MRHAEYFDIAIDGPAGASEGTITKLAVEEPGFVYVDTGAIYRSMALYFVKQGASPEDGEAIARACSQVEVTIRHADGTQQVILNGEDVSGLIRLEEVGRMASATSVHGPVRWKLVQLQKQLARGADVIMDGWDIGAYVLPDAPAKIYLTASVETRIRHRFRELGEEGVVYDIREVGRDIEEKGCQDMHRKNSPLRQAEDAVLLGSSHMTIDQVVGSIIHITRERRYEGWPWTGRPQ